MITPDTPIWSYNQVKALLISLKQDESGHMASIAEASNNSRFNHIIDSELSTLQIVYEQAANINIK